MPYAKLLLAAALVVVACFALVILLKSRRRDAGPMLTSGRGLPPIKGSLDADKRGRGVSLSLGEEIFGMLETGRRDEAVALIRERTGWGAEEAEAMFVKLENLWKRWESKRNVRRKQGED
jgi:hypothetical protein